MPVQELVEEWQEANDIVAQALEETSWPGRFEVVSRSPLMILDGAHNPHTVWLY